jgi:outer membrane protein TolC
MDKVKCYELRIEALKYIYKFTATRVRVGTDPSTNADLAKAAALEAEIALLKFKSVIEKQKK